MYSIGFELVQKHSTLTLPELVRLCCAGPLHLACKRRRGGCVLAYGEKAKKRSRAHEEWEVVNEDDPFFQSETERPRRRKQQRHPEEFREDDNVVEWERVGLAAVAQAARSHRAG